ncbi:MAG TPA: hypothetical protein VK566_01450 [Nitrososphaeraceae archaeon]|nr:hypothetical protein [Nitrososphaeraceae archaeon]
MANSGSPQTEITLDIWNFLTTVSGDIVTNVDSLQIKSARLRVPKVLFDKHYVQMIFLESNSNIIESSYTLHHFVTTL